MTAGDQRLPLEYGLVSKSDTSSALQWTLLVQVGYIRACFGHVVDQPWYWNICR